MVKRLIVFDFDGVLADSEVLANAVLAEMLTELGAPTTTEESLSRYVGKRLRDVILTVEETVGRPMATDFVESYQQRTLARLRADVRLVDGARAFLDSFADVPRCIASSSPPDRIAACLGTLGLVDLFDGKVFSASQVERGKPHPDIFLFAADRMGVSPADALVLEDSVGGVRAAITAGMTVIGLTAASHIRDGHAERLAAAGAHHVAATYTQAADIAREYLRRT
jgi:HAD superfamily hydrolase (TIGR01509 family)